MRIDAHHHFWQRGRFEYPWLDPKFEHLARDFGPDDLKPLLTAHEFDGSVLVQTISSLEETHWFLELAEQHSFIVGVVGWVDLTDPAIDSALDALVRHPLLVGIRHQVHDEADDRWLLREDVLRGLRSVESHGLSYDLLLRPRHLPVALEVARRLPGLSLVVDHLAKPDIARRGWDDWARALAELAKCDNVTAKLSGLVTEADWHAWSASDLATYVDHALQCFGPARLMFGSDWPVSLLAGSYALVHDAMEENLAALSADEQAEIFGHTAARVYRLILP